MRIAFAGTSEFARAALAALYAAGPPQGVQAPVGGSAAHEVASVGAKLHAAGHDIRLVLTQPDRPAGRGMKLQASPVKQFALEHGLTLAQPRSLRLDGKYPQDAAAAQLALYNAQPDVLVVAAYGLILPQWVLDAMSDAGSPEGAKTPSGSSAVPEAAGMGTRKLGCLNIHASLLPRWRGAAPIHRSIEAGDSETGITLMQMDAGLDTGDILAVQRVPIRSTDTTGSLHEVLAELGGRMIVATLAELASGRRLPARKQPEVGVTYAHKIEKHEAVLDWTQSADLIVRRIRAFNPNPGAVTTIHGEPVKVWAATVLPPPPGGAACAAVLRADREGIAVGAKDGVVNITQLQRPGAKRLSAAEFLQGFEVRPGVAMGGP